MYFVYWLFIVILYWITMLKLYDCKYLLPFGFVLFPYYFVCDFEHVVTVLWNGFFDKGLCQIDKIKQNKTKMGGRKIFCMLNFKMLFSDRRSLSHFLNETIKSENNTWKYIIQTQNYSLYCTMYKCNKCIVFVKF